MLKEQLKKNKVFNWLKLLGIILFVIVLFTNYAADKENIQYKNSNISYEELNSEIGCGSKYSKTKRKDVFNSKYKDHWMVWGGKVELSDADSVSLNCDGKGIQDLSITFTNKRVGYDLMEGDYLLVKFLMKSTGGCFLPFGGKKATILKWTR